MLALQLWTDFLSKTAPALNGSVLFVYLQMGIGAALPLLTLFHIVKRQSSWETLLVCIVPFVLISTAAIVEPLFFGSFLGEGFTKVDRLREFLLQAAFFKEAALLSGIFILSALLYLFLKRRDKRLSARLEFLSIGLEMLFAVFVLIVGIDYGQTGGALFHAMGAVVLKWYVYGLYLLLNKSGFFLLCLVWSLLFSERAEAADTDYLFDYEAWLRRYLTKNYRVIGCGLTLFGLFFAYVVVYQLILENPTITPMLLLMIVMNSLLLLPGLYCLLAACFPWCMPNYRRILTWGDPETTARQIYHEILQEEPRARKDIGISTTHYLILWIPYKRIFYWPYLESCTFMAWGAYRLSFKDGSRCNLNAAYQQLLPPMSFLENH